MHNLLPKELLLEKLFRAESMTQAESQLLFAAIVRGELEASQ
ncbi:anthranilate phosphoribosyltransferase, partial [Yersinia enterocolitica]